MKTEEVEAGEIEEGDLVVIDGEPCLVTSFDHSSPGKHGTPKVTIEGTGLTDGGERTLAQPMDAAVEVPVFETQRNPVISVGGDGGHFDPVGVTVPVDTNVVWLWDDDEPHAVAATDESFASDRESGEGTTFEHPFDEPGTYAYGCEVHGGTGVVVVEET